MQLTIACISALLLILPASVFAYEHEDAYPFWLSARGNLDAVIAQHVTLSGRNVAVRYALENPGDKAKQLIFSGHTKLFSQLGLGEEHSDKTFADIQVKLGDASITPTTRRRAFLDGRDITDYLARLRIEPIPGSETTNLKLRQLSKQLGVSVAETTDWQGFIAKSWRTTIAPRATAELHVSYQALPEFALLSTSTPHLAYLLRQHCANPTDLEVSGVLKEEYVIVEKYIVPANLTTTEPVELAIEQPKKKNWLGAQPLAVFACGLSQVSTSENLTYSGQWEIPYADISILVISKIANP